MKVICPYNRWEICINSLCSTLLPFDSRTNSFRPMLAVKLNVQLVKNVLPQNSCLTLPTLNWAATFYLSTQTQSEMQKPQKSMTTSGLFSCTPLTVQVRLISRWLQMQRDTPQRQVYPPLLFCTPTARPNCSLILPSNTNWCLGSDWETTILCVEQSKTRWQNRDGVSTSRITTASDWDFGDRPTIQSGATKTLYRTPPIQNNNNKQNRTIFPGYLVFQKKERPFFFLLPANVRFILWSPHRCPVSLLCLEGFIVPSLPLLPEVVIDRVFFSCCC